MKYFFSALLVLAVMMSAAACSHKQESSQSDAAPGTPYASEEKTEAAQTGAGKESTAPELTDAEEGSGAEETAAADETADTPAVTEAPSSTLQTAENTAASEAAAEQGGPCWVSGSHVNFRKTPDEGGEVISRLAKGTEVEKLGGEGDWLLVRYGDVTGYIHKDYVSTVPLPDSEDAVRIVVKKAERVLELWLDGTLFGSYRIGLGNEPVGHKHAEGDGKTPEGEYYICMKNSWSKYYLSLGISYPSEKDAAAALKEGRIDQAAYERIASANEWGLRPDWYTPLGGEIMIHGGGSSRDWTAGCIAVENEVMDVLFRFCPVGTRITILP